MTRLPYLALLAAVGLAAAACDEDDDEPTPGPGTQEQSFTVTIENLSTPQTLPTTTDSGAVLLSAGVFAVYTGANPFFLVGAPADVGTERLAEDGDPSVLASTFGTRSAKATGTFEAAAGADSTPHIDPGETATFTFTASPGDRLQIETAFLQSNDWFYALGADGLDLFNGNTAVSGDVTAQLVLYDAGTEVDFAPGTSDDQGAAQAGANTGAADANNLIRVASGFTIPPASSVIRVTITPQAAQP